MAATYNGSLDHTTDSGTAYKSAIDNNFSVLAQTGAAFAPHEASTPNMTVQIDAGAISAGTTVVTQSQQTSGTITAPSVNPRIDRVVIDAATAAISIITGAEAASPTAPAITAGKIPIAQIALATSTTAITNSLITDERIMILGANTAADQTVSGDWNHTGALQLGGIDIVVPSALSNYAGAQARLVRSPELVDDTYTDFSTITSSTVESYGPTGSSITSIAASHNQWTALNGMPSNTVAVKLGILNNTYAYSTVAGWAKLTSVYRANAGDSIADPRDDDRISTIITNGSIGTTSAQALEMEVQTFATVPVDSSGRFNVMAIKNASVTAGTATSGFSAIVYVQEFILG